MMNQTSLRLRSSTRRRFVKHALGSLAVGGLGLHARLRLVAKDANAHPLAPRPAHFEPKAKNLIVLFLTGGFSHVDTFDYKPRLQSDHGRTVDWRGRPFHLNASKFGFQPRGQSGVLVSELFPHVGRLVDDLAIIHSMRTDHISHGQATLAMHCGSTTVPLPSLGAWISYGLGSENANLPGFVVLAAHLPYMGTQPWDASFLPAYHGGTRLIPGSDPVPNLRSPLPTVTLRELERVMLQRINERHLLERRGDTDLSARIASFQTASGMMKLAPTVLDTAQESEVTRRRYGLRDGDTSSLGWQCLAARRLVEHGVRVVEIVDSGSSGNWDAHGDMQAHRRLARNVDQPMAALLVDLKQRGLLDETLVVICTEFGRAPAGLKDEKGRNHHNSAFTCLLAGAGVKGGTVYGKSDEYGMFVEENPVHVHDFHATILHLMGLDHEQLVYRYAGRDFRLTDVYGDVVAGVLA